MGDTNLRHASGYVFFFFDARQQREERTIQLHAGSRKKSSIDIEPIH